MNPISRYFITAGLALLMLRCANTGDIAGNGSQTGNPALVGSLYDTQGKPAKGVAVKLYPADYNPSLAALGKETASTTEVYTDERGHYSMTLPDSGTYNILGVADDGRVAFTSGVDVDGKESLTILPDTIRQPGSIRGVTFMPGLDSVNQIRVTMYLPGTGYITKPNIGGRFLLGEVPQGTYRLIFDPTMMDYFVKFMDVTVRSGQVTDLDTVILYGKSQQEIPSIAISGDTLVSINDTIRLQGTAADVAGQIIGMWWDIGATGVFIPTLSGDTSLVAPALEGLIPFVFRAMDNDSNMVHDTLNVSVSMDAPVADAGNDTAVAIGSTFTVRGKARQQFGAITKWEWDIGGVGFRLCSGSDTTIQLPGRYLPRYTCVLRVTDDDGNSGIDTILVALGDTLLSTEIPAIDFMGHMGYAVEHEDLYVSCRSNGGQFWGRPIVIKYSGTAWETIGPDSGFYYQAAGDDIPITVNNGVIHTVFFPADDSLAVARLDGAEWELIGEPGFTGGPGSRPAIATWSNRPCVAFQDGSIGGKLSVLTYDGTDWVTLGSRGISKGIASQISLAISPSNELYLSFTDKEGGPITDTDAGYAWVMKFTGTEWVPLGGSAVSESNLPPTARLFPVPLAFHDGNPVVAYQISGRVVVKKFTGVSWTIINGEEDFPTLPSTCITLGADSLLYLAFQEKDDVVSWLLPTVMVYDGQRWTPLIRRRILHPASNISGISSINGIPYLWDDGQGTGAYVHRPQ